MLYKSLEKRISLSNTVTQPCQNCILGHETITRTGITCKKLPL